MNSVIRQKRYYFEVHHTITFGLDKALFLFLLGDAIQKRLLRRSKSDLGKIWHDCSSSEFASFDGVGYLI